MAYWDHAYAGVKSVSVRSCEQSQNQKKEWEWVTEPTGVDQIHFSQLKSVVRGVPACVENNKTVNKSHNFVYVCMYESV